MKFSGNYSFDTEDKRKEFARFLSHTIDGNATTCEHTPNSNDDYFWKLDKANNWGLIISEEDPRNFQIRYRYQCPENQYEEALGGWLKIRLGVTIID